MYSLFVFTDWVAAAAPRDDKGVSGSSARSNQNAMVPRLRGDDDSV